MIWNHLSFVCCLVCLFATFTQAADQSIIQEAILFPQGSAPEVLEVSNIGQHVIITTQSTLLGTVAQWLQAVMAVMCDGDPLPAIDFFECLRNQTQIPQLWAAMGLNATSIKVQTIETTAVVGPEAVVDANSLLTLLNSNFTQLHDLLKDVEAQLPKFCLNIDPLMVCLRPYFDDCTTQNLQSTDDGDDTDVLSQDQNDATVSAGNISAPSNISGRADDEKGDGDWFNTNLPLITSPGQATAFFQNGLRFLCEKNATGIIDIVDNLPCLFKAAGNMSCGEQTDEVEQTVNANSSRQGVCSAVKGMGTCYLDNVSQSCQNPLLSSVLTNLGAQYLTVGGCNNQTRIDDLIDDESTTINLALSNSTQAAPQQPLNVSKTM